MILMNLRWKGGGGWKSCDANGVLLVLMNGDVGGDQNDDVM